MSAPGLRAAWAPVAACALAACVASADRGRVAGRLAPVPLAGWIAADEGWRARFGVADPAPGGDAMVLARAGDTRRLARLLGAPGESATRIPAGVREVRFWCSEPVAAAEPPPGCRVELEATWDAGAPAQIVSAPARPDAGSGWMSFRLAAAPQRHGSILRLRVRASPACSGVPIAVAQSEVAPVVPAVLEKRPSLVVVAFSGLAAGELDCAGHSRRAWPRVHNRWCVRGTRFADTVASAADGRAGLDALLSGEPPGRAEGATPLAALLQAQGYATFGVVPEGRRGTAWRGFDSRGEVAPATTNAVRPSRRERTNASMTLSSSRSTSGPIPSPSGGSASATKNGSSGCSDRKPSVRSTTARTVASGAPAGTSTSESNPRQAVPRRPSGTMPKVA